MGVTDTVKIIVEGEDKASGVLGRIGNAVGTLGKVAAIGAGAVVGATVAMGAGLVKLAADGQELVGVRDSFNALTADIEGGSARVLESLQEGARGLVTNTDLMKSYNTAQALISKEFAGNLGNVLPLISKAAAATGEDVGFLLDSYTRGIGRLSPMILDNLGIQVSLTDAYAAWSEQSGVAVEAMTKEEQQIAFNAMAMDKLKEKYEDLPELNKPLDKIKISLANMKEELSMKVLPALSPFFDLLGRLVSNVIPKLLRIFDPFLKMLQRVGDWFNKVAGWVGDGLMTFEDLFAVCEDGSSTIAGLFEAMGFGEETANRLGMAVGKIYGIFRDAWRIIRSFFRNLGEGMSVMDAFIEAIWDIAPKPVLDALCKIRDTIQPIIDKVTGWLRENVELKDVLIALGIVLGGVVLGALWAIATALAPIILLVGGLILAVTVVRKAWEENWGGIRDKVTEAWEGTIRPALEKIWDWLQVQIPIAIETAKQFWSETLWPALQEVGDWITGTLIPTLGDIWNWLQENIPLAIQTCADFWENTLKPALETVWDWIQNSLIPAIEDIWDWLETNIPQAIDNCKQAWDDLSTALENAWDWFSTYILPILQDLYDILTLSVNFALQVMWGLWANYISPALETAWDWLNAHIVPALEDMWDWIANKVNEALGPFKQKLDGAAEAFEWINRVASTFHGWLVKIKDILSKIELPDWLQTGSPSPLEQTLLNSSGYLAEMNNQLGMLGMRWTRTGSLNMNVNTGAAAPVAGGSARSVRIENVNFYIGGAATSNPRYIAGAVLSELEKMTRG